MPINNNYYNYGTPLDARLVGLFRQPTGESGQARTFNPNGEILKKDGHIGFKTSDVLTLTALFDADANNSLTQDELTRGIELLKNAKEDTYLGFALKQQGYQTDPNSGVSDFEQRRQISGSILQTLKDYFTGVDAGDKADGGISTQDLINVNQNDYSSRRLIDGESDGNARVLADYYFTNADLQASLGLSSDDETVKSATDPANIENYQQYQANSQPSQPQQSWYSSYYQNFQNNWGNLFGGFQWPQPNFQFGFPQFNFFNWFMNNNPQRNQWH